MFINDIIPMNSWLRRMAGQRKGLLLFLFAESGGSEEKDCRMVGEWCQQQLFFLLHVLVNLTGKTPTYVHSEGSFC